MKFIYSFLRIPLVSVLLCLLVCSHVNAQTLTAHPNVSMTSNSNGYYSYTPLGYSPTGTQTYPVLIAFGGLSQNGNGSAAQLDYVFSNWGGPGWQIINGKFPSSLTVNGQLFRFIVILPQFSSNASPKGVDEVISYVISNYKADPSRIYLTGNSSGGGYCWDYPGSSVTYGLRVAAVVPTCAAASFNTTKANNIAAANLPVWATHNAVDQTVSPNTTINFVNGINAVPVPPNPRAKMTIFKDVGHNCSDSTFNTTYGIGAYAWMLQYKRGSTPPVNQPPVAKAGNDVTLTLPTNSVQLNGNGSYDPDGTITYSWTKLAGPAQFTISNSTIVNPVFSNLVAGTYTLRLTVTDNNGAKSTDDINIIVNPATVNQPPVANAGPDLVITLPTNSATLSGSGTDPDGTISLYAWAKVTGPASGTIVSPAIAQTVVNNLVAGTYVFKLTVTDNKGATASDQMQLTVNAATGGGGTKNINVNIYGGSNAYNNAAWNNWDIGTTSATNITSSLFQYSTGASSTVKAVLSQTETLGDNGSAYQGGMAPPEVLRYTSYSKQTRTLTLSGLSTSIKYNIELYASRYNTTYSTKFIVNGALVTIATYQNFTNKAAFSNITPNAQGQIIVTIQSVNNGWNYLNGFALTEQGTNIPPVANAGPDVTITLPTSSTTLSGSGTDADGTISSYAWSLVSGPGGSAIVSPSKAQTVINNLVAGTYVFKLLVTDNSGATASDQMQLTVMAVAVTKTINVNLYGGSNPYNNAAWNNWNVGTSSSSNITSGLFKYSDGTSSPIKAVLSYSLAVGDNASNYGSGMAPPEVLRYTSDGQNSRTLTLSGLSTSLQYSIELYASRWSINNSTIFTINGISVTISTYYNFTATAVFSNISPNTQGQIVVGIQSATGWNYLNGFALTEQGSVPGIPASYTQVTSTAANNAAISELNNNKISAQVFPNPVADNAILQVNNSQSGNMKVDIINVNGALQKELILKHVSPVTKISIPMKELPPGVYIIKVQLGKWSASKKIVKS